MSKYDPLARHLSEQQADAVTMTFSQINDLLGGTLPKSAFEYRPWWANRFDGNDAQNAGWQSVGWETQDVDMKRRSVTFARVVRNRVDFKDAPYIKPLTIEEAKQGLAARFMVPASAIEITIRA
ncbi:hypothetical protein SCH01S_29_01000 [Sphingomonas changbaiensis NBRC 104936]|uniref:DUF7662 domain-containing protein n=1 Tax=Sphingomonas changbaiensis NBRC 104936 TaxID=1219043 RepID=A0A0E9MNT1_9SPHN|nr:hypothetical protein [Sphingomonas changbaiensis]GAO39412.1 hypothetical protein SCH01S_29_01000 [Sphingomonas changbaiensis NBRC 104936]